MGSVNYSKFILIEIKLGFLTKVKILGIRIKRWLATWPLFASQIYVHILLKEAKIIPAVPFILGQRPLPWNYSSSIVWDENHISRWFSACWWKRIHVNKPRTWTGINYNQMLDFDQLYKNKWFFGERINVFVLIMPFSKLMSAKQWIDL